MTSSTAGSMLDEAATVAELDRAHLWHPWSRVEPAQPRLIVTDGKGCSVTDAHGRAYLDLRAGTLNAAVGYRHPHVIQAMTSQAERLMTWDLGEATTVPAAVLAARIADLAPGALTRTLFCNSGSEAIEAAVKIARGWQTLSGYSDRVCVISLRDGYHGCTATGIAATGSMYCRAHAGPLPDGFTQVATPRCPDCVANVDHLACRVPGAEELDAAIGRVGPENVAAFVVEPVLSVGGVVVPPRGYLRAVREVCTRHGVLLIADEVATGFGRTGRWFGVDHEAVVPDILVTAKHLAAGYAPLSAVTVEDSIFAAFANDPYLGGLRHGHTTGGHAVACAAALAVLDVITAEGLVERAASIGAAFRASLEPARDLPGVLDVRGHGLLLGVELDSDRLAHAVAGAAQQAGVLVRPFGRVLTIAPPLIITEEEAQRGAQLVIAACAAASAVTEPVP